MIAINDGKLNKLNNDYRNWLNDAEKNLENAKSEQQKFEAQKKYEEKQSFILRYKNGIEVRFKGLM